MSNWSLDSQQTRGLVREWCGNKLWIIWDEKNRRWVFCVLWEMQESNCLFYYPERRKQGHSKWDGEKSSWCFGSCKKSLCRAKIIIWRRSCWDVDLIKTIREVKGDCRIIVEAFYSYSKGTWGYSKNTGLEFRSWHHLSFNWTKIKACCQRPVVLGNRWAYWKGSKYAKASYFGDIQRKVITYKDSYWEQLYVAKNRWYCQWN